MKRITLALAALVLTSLACGQSLAPQPTYTPLPTYTPYPTPLPTKAPTKVPPTMPPKSLMDQMHAKLPTWSFKTTADGRYLVSPQGLFAWESVDNYGDHYLAMGIYPNLITGDGAEAGRELYRFFDAFGCADAGLWAVNSPPFLSMYGDDTTTMCGYDIGLHGDNGDGAIIKIWLGG